MKLEAVAVASDRIAEGLVRLFDSIEPSDLPQIERACRGLYGFLAVLTQTVPPREALAGVAADVDRAALEAKCAELREAKERIVALEEMLALRAERAADGERSAVPVVLPEAVANRLVGLANRQPGEFDAAPRGPQTIEPLAVAAMESAVRAPAPDGKPDEPVQLSHQLGAELDAVEAARAAAKPSANGKHAPGGNLAARRLEIAKLLADGPLPVGEIMERLSIPKGSIPDLFKDCDWFGKIGTFGPNVKRVLTAAGRQALRDAGYVLVSDGETSPPPTAENSGTPEASGPVPESAPKTSPPAADPNPAQLARAQCKAIAEVIMNTDDPGLSLEDIATLTRLPENVVEHRLRNNGGVNTPDHSRYFKKLEKNPRLYGLTVTGIALVRGKA